MTQLTLFDSPANTLTNVVPSMATVSAPVTNSATSPVASSVGSTRPASAAGAFTENGGVQRMGDLARLVIMRYELVAQRRAALLARQKAK